MIRVRKTSRIFGEVKLGGAKNAALPIIFAACLSGSTTRLYNVPMALNDIKVARSLAEEIGIRIQEDNGLIIEPPANGIYYPEISDNASRIRSSLLLLPVLLIRCGRVSLPVPGGCRLGNRRYDILLNTLRQMGAEVNDDGMHITAVVNGRLKGCELSFHTATTSGSECAVLAAVSADGKTIIRNANTRPEVIDMIEFLKKLGAKITYSTRMITIEGVGNLGSAEYTVLYDRHEAVSYMILAAMLRSEIKIKNLNLGTIEEDITLLRKIGVEIYTWGDEVYVSAKGKNLTPFSLTTSAYPGINSDMQPLFAALALTIEGESIITDTRFTERFQYVEEFKKLGADIVNYENCAIIHGGKPLSGTAVTAVDLRAGAALTFLGGFAEGETTVENFYQVDRGYENFLVKLSALGFNASAN